MQSYCCLVLLFILYSWQTLPHSIDGTDPYLEKEGNVADERVILFLAIFSSDNLQLGIQLGLWLGLVLIVGLTSTFRTPAKFIHNGSSATLPKRSTGQGQEGHNQDYRTWEHNRQCLKTFLFVKSYPDVIFWTQTLQTISFS